MNENDRPNAILKRICNGTTEQVTEELIAEVKLSSVGIPENAMTFNGLADIEDMQVSYEGKKSEEPEGLQNIIIPTSSEFTEAEDAKPADCSDCVNGERTRVDTTELHPSKDVCLDILRSDKDNAQNERGHGAVEPTRLDCDMNKDEDGAFDNVRSNQRRKESKNHDLIVARSEKDKSIVRASMKNGSSSNQGSDTKDEKCSTPSQEMEENGSSSNQGSEFDNKDEKCSTPSQEMEESSDSHTVEVTKTQENVDLEASINDGDTSEKASTKDGDTSEKAFTKDGDTTEIASTKDVDCSDIASTNDGDTSEQGETSLTIVKKIKGKENPKNAVKVKCAAEHDNNLNEEKSTRDAEHENQEKCKRETGDVGSKCQKVEVSKNEHDVNKNDNEDDCADSSVDDIEIIGESRVIEINKPNNSFQKSQNIVFVPGSLPSTSSSMLPSLSKQSTPVGRGTGYGAQGSAISPGFALTGGVPFQASQNAHLLAPPVAPPKPKSSLDQIELIRWEIQNRINTRPKYFKPSPASDLGSLAKYLFDIGSDLIKEAVYHDLVKIQSRKNSDDKLNDKEKEDLGKLKEIEKDLFATIGHLKLKLKKRCQICNFHTESNNVMFYHKQFPHEDNKCLRCAYCQFVTKQAVAFKFHMESEHAIHPRLHDKKAFYECDLCPYENNQEEKVILHKQRCLKQFRPLFNLHPSCLSGAEINLCLENIFYKTPVPKNLKFPQQISPHQQQVIQAEFNRQQAAQAEARRQQIEMQTLAAQKNAAAIAAKKQQQVQRSISPIIAPRYNAPPSGRFPVPGQQQPIRYNAKVTRPTVANMLNNKQNSLTLPTGTSPNAAAGGFEVCEICDGYVKDRKALRIHFFYAHRIDLPVNLFERNQAPLYCATCYVRFWTAQGLRKHIDSHKEENQMRGVVGKCISCGHHVLNLLLHMRVVHNREMQHYINALMCMFCGSYFGTRQLCEQHILKVHGHVDPVTGNLKSAPLAPAQQQQTKKAPLNQRTPLNQKAPLNQNRTGNNSLVKGSMCVLCNLNFGRNVDLTRHCMRMHHTCMKCGMVVIDKASLMKHTCLSSPSGTRDCSMCQQAGFHPAYYVKHLRDKHLRKFTISVSRLGEKTIEQWTKRPSLLPDRAEVAVEISDSDEDAGIKPNSTTAQITAGKRQKIGPACKIGRSSEKPAAEVFTKDEHEKDVTPEEEDVKLSSANEDSISSASQKRKSSDSCGYETSSKRKKSS